VGSVGLRELRARNPKKVTEEKQQQLEAAQLQEKSTRVAAAVGSSG